LIGDADLIEDFGEVVRDDGVAGPLREETESDEDQETVTISFGFEELKDTVLGKLLFEGERCFDFTLHKLDSDVVGVIESIVMREDPECPVGSVLLDVPTRTLTTFRWIFWRGYGTNQIPMICRAAKIPWRRDGRRQHQVFWRLEAVPKVIQVAMMLPTNQVVL